MKKRDTSWDTPYIHGANQEAKESSQVKNFNATFEVHLDEKKTDFTPEEFLHTCWTNGFDSPCRACREPFDLATEPPVRLLSLGPDTQTTDPLTKKLPPLFILNYHLRCIKTHNIKYLPVSHPWHPSIAEAYALRTFNAEAAQTCYEAPVRTLLAVTRHFGSDCLLWHDYISIPQWQDDLRGTVILPQIFKIFEGSGSAILHIGHQPPPEVVKSPSLENISRYNDDLRRFFQAHLFSRLWPIVEFNRAGQAYIMNKEYGIMESKFSVFVGQIIDALNKGSAKMSSEEMASLRWIYNLPLFVQEQQKNKCLGYVYDMIANLGCRSFRDKFIGASELLGIPDYPTKLPTDTQDACLWLAEQQINSNDLSPSLLRPSNEPAYEKAGWLKGHTLISDAMWGWGIQIHPASATSQVQDHSVHLEMNLAGTITSSFSWQLRTENDPNSSSHEILDLMKSSNGSTTAFLKRLESIDPTSIFHCDSSSNTTGFPRKDLNLSSSKVLMKTLGSLLHQHMASTSPQNSAESQKTYEDIISLLALSASVPTPELDHFEPLNFHQLRRQICNPNERTLVSITCPNCQKQSLFRVEVWQKPTNQAQLYLIPGLTYQYTARGGTGIMVEENRIIGRARFCAAACGCNHAVPVKLI